MVRNEKNVLLKEILNFDKGIEPGEDKYCLEDKKNYIKHFRVADINNKCMTYIEKSEAKIISSYGDILVSFDGTPGKITISANGSFCSGIRKITSKYDNIPNWFIYGLFQQEYIQQIIKMYSTGSNILHASNSINYLSTKINDKLIKSISKYCNDIYERQIICYKKIDKLNEYKKYLLPLMLNEQVL